MENKQETHEYSLLQHIKFCLECKNESQAIRLIEQYGFDKQEQDNKMYSEEEVNELLNLLEQSIKEINHIKITYKDKGHCVKYLSDCEDIIEQFKNK
jgi:hypothetical protein